MSLRTIVFRCGERRLLDCLHYRRLLSSSSQRRMFNDKNPLAAKAEKILTSQTDLKAGDPSLKHALSLVRQAILQDSPRAKTLLASMHNVGLGVKHDTEVASRLFLEAAEAGDPVAQCSLGVLQLEDLKIREDGSGVGVASSDFVVGIDERGEMRGRLELERRDGSVDDTPTPADLVRRVRKARRKAGFTDQEAKEYEQHREQQRRNQLDEARKIALSWLEKATEQGIDVAMVTLGNELLFEQPARAVSLYEQAIKASRNTDAYFNLGQVYTKGLEGFPPNSKLALKNFAMAAQLGDASAQFYLGHLYRAGSHEVQIDHASSRQYIDLAAKQGHPGALYYLALMHRSGEGGLEPNRGAFHRYLKASADAGYGPAFSHLGEMHYKGTEGVEANYEKALQYFMRAGELKESEALCSAAAMHFHGFGTEEDHHQAFLLYQEAAQLGSIQALRSIGSMYFHGHGMPANRTVAEHFFRIADENEVSIQEEAEHHMNRPVKRTPAPKHPMADIPRFVKTPGEEQSEKKHSEKEYAESPSTVPPKQ